MCYWLYTFNDHLFLLYNLCGKTNKNKILASTMYLFVF